MPAPSNCPDIARLVDQGGLNGELVLSPATDLCGPDELYGPPTVLIRGCVGTLQLSRVGSSRVLACAIPDNQVVTAPLRVTHDGRNRIEYYDPVMDRWESLVTVASGHYEHDAGDCRMPYSTDPGDVDEYHLDILRRSSTAVTCP